MPNHHYYIYKSATTFSPALQTRK